MKIGIDARFYGITGIGRYIKNLISQLEEIDQENHYTILLGPQNFSSYEPQNKNFSKKKIDCRWYTFKEQINLLKILNRESFDLIHFPNFNFPIFYQKPFVMTIHDLIHLTHATSKGNRIKKSLYFLKKMGYLFAIRRGSQKAKVILTPSHSTKREIYQKLKINPEKIFVTYEGFDSQLRKKTNPKEESKILNKYQIQKPYLLYIATMFPHKNHRRLLQSLPMINKDFQLVLIGKTDYFAQEVKEYCQKLNLEKRVIFPGFQANNGYTPDEDLAVILKNSFLYVFPSLKEGFGIPVLEAQANRIPVICSRIPSLKEIAQDSAEYFDPLNPKNIAEKANLLINNQNRRNELIEKGENNFKRFSWAKMAKETLKIYQDSAT